MNSTSRKLATLATTVATFWLFSAAPASSPRVTYERAGDLNRLCTAKNLNWNAMCDGFIFGIFEVIANSPVYGYSACVPRSASATEALDLIKKWLGSHREMDTQSASLVVAKTIAGEYPCK